MQLALLFATLHLISAITIPFLPASLQSQQAKFALAAKSFDHSINPSTSNRAAANSVRKGTRLVSVLEKDHDIAQVKLGQAIAKANSAGNSLEVARLSQQRDLQNIKFLKKMGVVKEKGVVALQQFL
jgi:hypothetical protein